MFLPALLLFLQVTGSTESSLPIHTISRVSGAIHIDGRIGDDEWKGVTELALPFETSPGQNTQAPVRTQAFLAFDAQALYVAFRAWDPQMRALRASIRDRDAAFLDDYAGIVLDTFHDRRRAFEFFVNPFGVQMDRSIADGSDQAEAAWDATWSSAARRFEDRWEVEMAIPFAALRFTAADPQSWGFDLVRIYPRDQTRRLALSPLDANRSCYVCQLAQLNGLSGIRPGRNIELAPTVTVSQTGQRPAAGTATWSEQVHTSPGLTARWSVTPSLILNAALNPDFSHIEADAPVIDANQPFTLSYPEKRPFFLEGGDLFATPIRIVYTRTAADPDWGAKVTWKGEGKGAGAFIAEDAITGAVIPDADRSSSVTIPGASVASVLRYRHDLGGHSTLGVTMTNRRGHSYSNDVIGADALVRMGSADTIAAQIVASRTSYPESVALRFEQPSGSFDGAAFYGRYEHRTRAVFWTASYDDTTSGFRADSGFVPQVGLRHGDAAVQRTWWPDRHPFLVRSWIGAEWDLAKRPDGSLLEDEREVWAGFSAARQTYLQLVLGERRRSFLRRVFAPEQTIDLAVRAELFPRVGTELEVGIGDTIDFVNGQPARRLRIAPLLRLEPTRRLAVDLQLDYERLAVEGGRLFRAYAGAAKAVYHLNLRTLLRVTAQYSDVLREPLLYREHVQPRSRRLLPQALFSYKLNPQTVLFAGFSSTSLGGQRSALTERNRTLFLKVGYAWSM